MDFKEFEFSVLSEPNRDSDEIAAKAQSCPESRALKRKAALLEQQLVQALGVSVPDSLRAPVPDMAELEARLQDASADQVAQSSDNVVPLQKKAAPANRFAVPAWIGLAACLALVVGLVLRQPEIQTETPMPGGDDLIAEVIEHLGPELSSMQPSDVSLSIERVSNVLEPAGARMVSTPGPISYAKSCVINGQLIPHLVVQGENGPVTILVMPNQMVDGPMTIMRGGFEGIIMPAGDGGSVAIIGRDSASVEAVRKASSDTLGISI